VKLRALDLFCGAGGVGMGLHRAGFHVLGVDLAPQPRYPFAFVQSDALSPPVRLSDFDLVWASPPCQAHTPLRHINGGSYECYIDRTRELLARFDGLTVIENVPGAPVRPDVVLCGTMFGLGTGDAELRRHRWFETNFFVMAPPHMHGSRVIGVYGKRAREGGVTDTRRATVIGVHGTGSQGEGGRWKPRTISVTGNTPQTNVVRNQVRRTFSVHEAREAMGIDWMTIRELSQAIPPDYSEHIGRYALKTLARVS
jgi:DNA (cytosine-5)-methyltransferase 1